MELGLGFTEYIPIIMYVGVVVFWLLILFYKIEVGIYFLVPLLPLQNLLDRFEAFPMGKDTIDIFIFVMLIRWLIDALKSEKKEGWLKSPINIPIFLIILWTFLELWRGSLFMGLSHPIHFDDDRFIQWKNYLILPSLYLIIVNNIKTVKDIRILALLMTLSMLYMNQNYYSNTSYMDRSHFSYDVQGAGTFTYLGANELAIFYAQYTMVLICLFLLEKQSWSKWIYGVVAVLNFYPLMFLFSRGGYMAAGGGILLIGFLVNRKILLLLLVFAAFWTSIVPNSVKERIEMTKTEDGLDQTILQREAMWDMALGFVKQNPLLGTGYHITPYLNIHDEDTGKKRNNLHNGYVQVLLELGLVGLLIYLLFYFIAAYNGWQLYRLSSEPLFRGLGIGLVICTASILAGNITTYCWHFLNVAGFFWIYMAMVNRGLYLTKNSQTETEIKTEQFTLRNYGQFVRPGKEKIEPTTV